MSNPRDRAVELLTHYITLLMERPGTRVLKIDNDTYAEIADVVDSIVEAAADSAVERVRNMVRDGVIREGE